MSWISRVFPDWANPAKRLENPKNPITGASVRQDFGVPITDAAKLVTESTAMQVPVYFAGVKLISEAFASLQVQVFQELDNGNTVEVTQHPANYLLSVEPKIGGNAIYSSFTFKEAMMQNCINGGNAYARIWWDQNQEPRELELFEHDKVTIHPSSSRRKIVYHLEDRATPLQSYDILHVPMMTDGGNGYEGVGLLHYARESLGLAIAAQTYMNSFFMTGAQMTGVIEHPGRLSPAALQNFLTTWQNKFHGIYNAGSTAVLEEGMQFKKTGITPQEAALSDIKKLVGEDIVRFLGIPQHLVHMLERSTNNNIEQQALEFVTYFFRPHIKRWENEFNRKLFTDDQKENGMYLRFNLDSLLRADSQARAELYSTLFNIGVLSGNDIRAKERMNKVDGLDKYYRPLNMADAQQDITQQEITNNEAN